MINFKKFLLFLTAITWQFYALPAANFGFGAPATKSSQAEPINYNKMLIDGILSKQIDDVQTALKNIENPNFLLQDENFPLFLAVEQEFYEAIYYLIQHPKILIDQQTNYVNGNTALIQAASKGNMTIVNMLENTKRVDKSLKNKNGKCFYDFDKELNELPRSLKHQEQKVKNEKREKRKLLNSELTQEREKRYKNDFEESKLATESTIRPQSIMPEELAKLTEEFFAAVQNGQIDKVTELLPRGVNLFAKNKDGMNCLMLAAKYNQLEMNDYLYRILAILQPDHSAFLQSFIYDANIEGDTPAKIAAKNDHLTLLNNICMYTDINNHLLVRNLKNEKIISILRHNLFKRKWIQKKDAFERLEDFQKTIQERIKEIRANIAQNIDYDKYLHEVEQDNKERESVLYNLNEAFEQSSTNYSAQQIFSFNIIRLRNQIFERGMNEYLANELRTNQDALEKYQKSRTDIELKMTNLNKQLADLCTKTSTAQNPCEDLLIEEEVLLNLEKDINAGKFIAIEYKEIKSVKEANLVLYDAIAKFDVKEIKFALDHAADINIELNKHNVLAWAIWSLDNVYNTQEDAIKVLKFLIDNGANVKDENNSALTLAIDKNFLKVARFLIDSGADLNLVTNGYIPLTYCVIRKNLKDFDFIKYIIERTNLNILINDVSPLFHIANLYVDESSDEYNEEINKENEDIQDIVELMILNGADINAVDQEGNNEFIEDCDLKDYIKDLHEIYNDEYRKKIYDAMYEDTKSSEIIKLIKSYINPVDQDVDKSLDEHLQKICGATHEDTNSSDIVKLIKSYLLSGNQIVDGQSEPIYTEPQLQNQTPNLSIETASIANNDLEIQPDPINQQAPQQDNLNNENQEDNAELAPLQPNEDLDHLFDEN